MPSLTLSQAEDIVSRIISISESGGFLRPVALSSVGASSAADAVASLYLIIANMYRAATLHNTSRNHELLETFIESASGTSMWITLQFRPDGVVVDGINVDDSLKHMETVDSYVSYLRTLDPTAEDYWHSVYSRIGFTGP